MDRRKTQCTFNLICLALLIGLNCNYSSEVQALVETPGIPKLPYVLDGEVKVFNLVAEEVRTRFNPKVNRGGIITWGYNGSVPGPTIEVFEGDTVRIEFENRLSTPTTVHWHGLHVPNSMDGASMHTQRPVPPGGRFTYEFTLKQHGTFMYHSGHMGALQLGMGLGGFFIVHPKEPQGDEVDKDYALMLQIWSVPPHANLPDTMSMNFNYFTINGKVAPAVEHLRVNLNDRVRIRIANLSMMAHPIHLHGYTFQVTGTDGGPIQKSAQWPASTINISAGETRDIEFVANNPGDWIFHCHFLHHITNDMDRPPIPGQPMLMVPAQGMFTVLEVASDSNVPDHHEEK